MLSAVRHKQTDKNVQPQANQPIVTKAVAPIFPPVGRAGLISDDIVVEGSVHPSGVFVTVKVISGHVAFHNAVQEAARQWKFAPYINPPNGKFQVARITFSFRIATYGTPTSEMTPIFYPPNRVEVKSVIAEIR
jgi:outer membrane biosynthesis protein TonB